MIYLSASARRVADWMTGYGIELLDGQHLLLEYAVARYWPNHILGVLERCFKNGARAAKLFKAQDLGWTYFVQPVEAMLGKRRAAHRAPPSELDDITDRVYRLVQSRLLVRDMNDEEAALVIVTLPLAVRDSLVTMADVRAGIQICRQRDARTPHYLHGVVRRSIQERMGKRRERERDRQKGPDLWVPEVEPLSRVSRASLAEDWEQRRRSIDVIKDIRRHATQP